MKNYIHTQNTVKNRLSGFISEHNSHRVSPFTGQHSSVAHVMSITGLVSAHALNLARQNPDEGAPEGSVEHSVDDGVGQGSDVPHP